MKSTASFVLSLCRLFRLLIHSSRPSFALFCLVLFFSNPAHAQIIWTGNTSTDWNTGSNWSTNSVPTSSGNVNIDAGSGNQPVISTANATADFLTVGLDANSTASTLLTIHDAHTLATSGNATIGSGSGATGAVLVSDLNTLWSVAGNFSAGLSGIGNLTVAQAASANFTGNDANGIGAYIGADANSTGTVMVADALHSSFIGTRSTLNVNTGALALGYDGTGNLTIANGGGVNASGVDAQGIGAYVGHSANSTGTVTVTGGTFVYPGSPWFSSQFNVNSGALAVGYNGTGALTVANGSAANLNGNDANGIGAYLGYAANSTGTVLIRDELTLPNLVGATQRSGLTLNSGALAVGYNGAGNLTIANAGTVRINSSDANGISAYVGYGANSTGNVTVTDLGPISLDGSALSVFSGALAVGYNGHGSLLVANGGNVSVYGNDPNGIGAYIGYGANSTGSVTVSNFAANNETSVLRVGGGALAVGYDGNGTLLVANICSVTANSSDSHGVGMYIGYGANSTASVTVQDATVVTLGGGSTLALHSEMDVTGGVLLVGNNGNGSLTVANGAVVNAQPGVLLANQAGSHGSLAINTNGVLIVGGQNGLAVGSGTGSISLDGGIIRIPSSEIFNGFGFTTVGDDLTTSANLTLNNSNAQPDIIDTNGANATLTGVISGVGSLGKISNGTLTLNANETYTGYTIVTGGTLAEGANGSISPASTLIVDGSQPTINSSYLSGVTSGASGANFAIAAIASSSSPGNPSNTSVGVDLANSTATFDFGANHSGTFTSVILANGGSITGTGNSTLTSINNFQLMNGTVTVALAGNVSLIKTGSGVVTLTGNNTYSNGTAVDGGLINFNSGNNFGPANLTLAGGGLQWAANNTLDISSRLNPLGAGNDTFDTNGNNIAFASVVAGSGTLVKAGDGTLTLTVNNTYTGGTVLAGGLVNFNSLNNFGPGGFTLSGGGLQWAPGNALDISAFANPLGAGNETFDTNGNDVTFATNLAGSGALVKAGLGNLTLASGNNSYTGGTVVTGGQLIVNGSTVGQSSSNFTVGNLGNVTASLLVANGANIAAQNLSLGDTDFSNGTALVTGPNTTLNLSDTLYVGNFGIGNLSVLNGGKIIAAGALLAGFQGNEAFIDPVSNQVVVSVNSGSVLVSGANSSLIAAAGMSVGQGGNGTLTIANGGYVAAAGFGFELGQTGTAITLVTDPGSKLMVNGQIKVGFVGSGSGNLTVANGGNVSAGSVVVGSGITGTVLVTDANSTLHTTGDIAAGSNNFGGGGAGSLTVANGGSVTSGANLTIGGVMNNDTGAMLVTGFGSTLSVANDVIIGIRGTGNLTVANGGNVNINSSLILTTDALGGSTFNSANGTVLVTDANSTLHVAGGILVGANSNTGTGNLTVANGGLVSGSGILDIAIGSFAGPTVGTVLVTDPNSILAIADGITVGEAGHGTLMVANGGLVSLSSGSNITLAQNTGSNGTVNLNGGTLSVGGSSGIQAGSGNYAFNFGGGTLQVANTNLTTSINATLVNTTTSTIDTNGLNATWSGVLSGSGNLTKIKPGALTLSGNNTYTGNTMVNGGALLVSNNGTVSATGTGAVTVGVNGTLAGTGNVGGNTSIGGKLQAGTSGSAGLLSFGNNLVLGTTALTLFHLGGTTLGTQYGSVNVGGNLTLGGTFLLGLINGYAPALSDAFSLLSVANTLSGSFSNFVLTSSGDGLDWNVSQLDATGNLSLDAPTVFATWAADSGLSGADALATAKPFGGPANLLRYAMNLDLTATPVGRPSLSTANISGVNSLVIQYRVRKNMTDCQLVPRYSTDLATWTDVDAGSIQQVSDADPYTAQYQASVALPATGAIFLRVEAQTVP